MNSIAQALGGRVMRVVEENEASTVSGESTYYDGNGLGKAETTRMSVTPITSGQLRIKSNVQLIVEIES